MDIAASASEMMDKWLIQELSAQFNHAVDTATLPLSHEERRRTTEAFCNTFVEDGVLEVVGLVTQRGHDAIGSWTAEGSSTLSADFKTERAPLGRTIHSSTDHLITVTGDRATQVSYVVVYRQVSLDFLSNGLLIITERFNDELVRTAEGWRFTHRRMEIVHSNADLDAIPNSR